MTDVTPLAEWAGPALGAVVTAGGPQLEPLGGDGVTAALEVGVWHAGEAPEPPPVTDVAGAEASWEDYVTGSAAVWRGV